MNGNGRHLAFGQFLGRVLFEADARDLAVQEVAARPEHRTVPRHTHEHPHFCLLIAGSFETTTHTHNGRCGSGTLLFHPYGTTHSDRFLSPTGRCVMISLRSDVLERFGAPRLSERSIALDDAEIGFPGGRLRHELRAPDALSGTVMAGLALEMLGHVLQRAERSDLKRPGWLSGAVAFLRESATDPVRVADVAEVVGVHPVHLARVFRRHLDLSPGEYLRRARVRAAMKLLERTAEPLATIAVRAGFCDQSALTKAFHRELGTTPAAYREAVRR